MPQPRRKFVRVRGISGTDLPISGPVSGNLEFQCLGGLQNLLEEYCFGFLESIVEEDYPPCPCLRVRAIEVPLGFSSRDRTLVGQPCPASAL